MGDGAMIAFTEEEQRYIVSWVRDGGPRHWAGFYAAVLVAPISMAAYGFIQRDVLAMGIAFVGLLAMVIWGVSSAGNNWHLMKSICIKLTTELQSSRQ
jgi:hypothetical protein